MTDQKQTAKENTTMNPMPMKGGPGRMNRPKEKPKNTKETLKRLVAYLKTDLPLLGLVGICILLQTGTTLAGAYMLRPIINGLQANRGNLTYGLQSMAKGLLIMAGIYFIGVGAQFIQSRIMIGISQKALRNIRNDLFSKMQKLPVKFYDTNNHGELMSRFTNDVDTIGEMLNNTIVQLFSGSITLIGALICMIYTNVTLTLVTVVVMPIIIKGAGMVGKYGRKYFAQQQSALGKMNGYIEESVSGQKVIKVFNHENVVIEEFQELNEQLKEKQFRAQFIGGLMGPVMNGLNQVNYTITSCVGGILCVARGFDIGGLTIFVNYSRQFARPINEISMQMNNIFSALAGAERVFHIMDQTEEFEQDGTQCLDKVRGEVALEHVTFGYDEQRVILHDISLTAKPGQKIAFVGSTGAGKTTITNLINRFYEVQKGTIFIDGTPITQVRKDNLRQQIAMVLQDTHLFTGTIRENIRYGRLDATDEEVVTAAKVASAHSFIKRLPDGYDTKIEGDGANLSQGQRQLLNIARAAISKAPILILDEATSSVDTRTEKNIEEGMDRLMENRTTFVIAHRLSTVRNADAIMVLEQGRIIEQGSHEELLAKKGRYNQLYTGIVELD